MKKIPVIFFAVISIFLFGCGKEQVSRQQDSSTTNPVRVVNPASTMFTSCNNWNIASFTKNQVNLTANYSGTSMNICPGNTFSISNNVMSEAGKWFFGGNEDGSVVNLHINYNTTVNNDAWNDLQDIWKVNSMNESSLSLQSADGSKSMNLEREPG